MIGVAPSGPNGYFQPLQLREVTPEIENTSAELSDPRLAAAVRIPDSAYVVADLARLDVDLTGPMTFVGKGVCDANSGRDDADVDLMERFAVIVAGMADGLPSERAAVRSEVAAKWACVAKHGAIGLVSLRTPKTTVLPWASTIAAYRSGAMGLVDRGTAVSRSAPCPALVVDVPAARAMLAAVDRNLETEEARAASGKFDHFELPGTLRLRFHGSAKDLGSSNVIGRIAGSDPLLAREAIVISAHLDHLGVDGRGRSATAPSTMPPASHSCSPSPTRSSRYLMRHAVP